MKNLGEYIINFGHLKSGKHEYDFEVDEGFFQNFEYSLVKSGKLHLHLLLDKVRENFFTLYFDIQGDINVECDRCLDIFSLPVSFRKEMHVKLENQEDLNENDELIFLKADAYELDISPFVYDFINLSLPLKRVCSVVEKECNPEMVNYLRREEDHQNQETDPRWAELKKLTKN